MQFDQWWNSQASDAFRAMHPEMDGEHFRPVWDEAIAATPSAAFLRECRAALDDLIRQKPTMAGLICGSTTLGNPRAELGAYRDGGFEQLTQT